MLVAHAPVTARDILQPQPAEDAPEKAFLRHEVWRYTITNCDQEEDEDYGNPINSFFKRLLISKMS